MPKKNHQDAPGDPAVGSRLRVARKAVGLSQVALAKKARIAQEQLSRFETGERGLETPRLTRLFRVAAENGIDLHYVMLERGQPVYREPLLLAADPSLAGPLAELAKRLKQNRE